MYFVISAEKILKIQKQKKSFFCVCVCADKNLEENGSSEGFG